MTQRPPFSKEHLQRIRAAMQTPITSAPVEAADPELMNEVAPMIYWLCQKYFRLEVHGIENVPPGKALVVGNHNSGVSFYEAIGVGSYWYLQHGMSDMMHSLAHDAIINLPLVGNFMRRVGALQASHESAHQAFARNRKVLVFPGGNLEAFRPYQDRHRIVFGNRKGFIKLAIREQVPIVPTVFLGGHEGFYVLNDGARISQLLGLKKIPFLRSDTWPLMLTFPWGLVFGPLAHIPLPTKCVTQFLSPIEVRHYSPDDADNPAVLDEVYNQVVNTMQHALSEMAANRRFPILG